MFIKKTKLNTLFLVFLAVSSGAVYADTSNSPMSADGAYKHQETAMTSVTVDSVDMANRILVLTDDSGAKYKLNAGPSVNNLSQMHSGDKLDMKIVASIAANIVDKNDRTSIQIKDRQSSAEGSLPSYHFKSSEHTTVQILNISKEFDAITVRTVKGKVKKIEVKKPELQKRLQTLKVGDNVAVDIIILADVVKKLTMPSAN